MKTRLFLLLPLALLLCAPHAHAQRRRAAAAPAGDAAAERPGQTLPIRRVILYSNGVAYVERRGTVAGRAEINLSFKQSQVDDVLKSMVVLDLGQGRVGAVSYNSSAPPSARMADIPFSISAETRGGASGGLAGVLAQLQGARVVVTTKSQRTATGSVLTVEERKTQTEPSQPPVITHALVIVADGGELMSFDLADVRAVRLADEGARRDISEFASASASARRRDAKTITVTSDGAGARELLVSYTVAAPIWKTTYRVVLGDDGKPFFQGWAIVDNVSEEDWDDVQLSLVSGTPVSFIQPIQKPLYRYRPVIPVPADLQLSPQVHEPETGEVRGSLVSLTGSVTDPNGAFITNASVTITNTADNSQHNTRTNDEGVFVAPLAPGNYNVAVNSPGFSSALVSNVKVTALRPAHINVSLNVGSVTETVSVTADSAAGARPNSVNELVLDGLDQVAAGRGRQRVNVGDLLSRGEGGVRAAAEGAEVGDLFEYQIAQPVTVKRDRSALIPILQTKMEGARVSVYNEAAGRTRPLGGMLLKNTSALTLEDGALTVIDGNAYAGEALLERLKPGEQRLVSFALDLGTLVTVREEEDNAPAHFVRIANGVLQAHFHRREKKIYTLTNQTDRKRVVYVEHPVRDDWELDSDTTPKPEGKSARFYRFRVELDARQTVQFPVAERETALETYAITNISNDQLALFVARRYLDQPTRLALQNIIELKARLAAAHARLAALEREAAEIAQDQKRLRENISALANTAQAQQLIARYVSKADQQESRLEQLARERQSALEERTRLQSQLDEAIRTLSLDHKPAPAVADSKTAGD